MWKVIRYIFSPFRTLHTGEISTCEVVPFAPWVLPIEIGQWDIPSSNTSMAENLDFFFSVFPMLYSSLHVVQCFYCD